MTFASALAGSDPDALAAAREAVAKRLGPAAVVAASIIAANFSMLDCVANAIGISVDSMILEPSADFRAALGINQYPSARNTLGPA